MSQHSWRPACPLIRLVQSLCRRGRNGKVPAVDRLSVNDLARCCAEETNKFLRNSASNDRYCLELFRRAIVKRDEDAWACLYQQYAPLVLTWVNQHQSATSLLGQDGGSPLVNAAFAKFAQALTPAKMGNFDSLAAILKYLKMCVHSVIADEVRARQARLYEETLDAIEQEPSSEDPGRGCRLRPVYSKPLAGNPRRTQW